MPSLKFESRVKSTPKKMRHVGFEVECILGANRKSSQFFKRTQKFILCQKDDGSLYPSDRKGGDPSEIVTHPLLKARKTAINSLCKEIVGMGGYVNKSCGGHIHIDARDIEKMILKKNSNDDYDNLQKAAKLTSLFEAALFAVTGQSRLNSEFCCPLVLNGNGDVWGNREELLDMRYWAVNFSALEEHGTVEFRCFAGSLRPERWLARTALAEGIVNNIKKMLNDKTSIRKLLKYSPFKSIKELDDYCEGKYEKADFYCKMIKKSGPTIIKNACKANKVPKKLTDILLQDHAALWADKK